MTREEARGFSLRWLPAWTGNKPKELAAYYSEDAFYSDPGIPNGVEGKEALLGYFQKLLSQNPDWVWTQIEAIPMEDGFLNKWHAKIPVGPKIVACVGVCLVQLDSNALIKCNEVYFDRTELVKEISKARKQAKE